MQRKSLMRAGAVAFATLVLLVLSSSVSLFAQLNTGKVEGIIRDKDTGAPLSGAQVIIDGTRLGNVSNADGYYFILNIPPGLRSVTFTYTGYQKTTISDVQVLAGQTMTVDGSLSSTVVQIEGITIEGEREELMIRDNTSTKRRMTSEQIEATPVTQLEDMMVLEAGVQEGGADARSRGFQIRGGRLGEESMVVDGVTVRNYTADVMSGGGGWRFEFETGTQSQDSSPLEFSTASVEQVDIITGGFQAEYGNVQSGIINIVTKEGGAQYRGNARFTSDGMNPRTSDYGYSQLTAGFGGPVPAIPNLYFYLSGEAQGREDRSPTHADEGFRGVNQEFVDRLNASVRNDPYFEGRQPFSLEGMQTARAAYAENMSTADYPVDASLFTPSNPVRLPGNWQDRSLLQAKVTFAPMDKLKIIATNHWSRNQHSYPTGSTMSATGDYFRDGIIDLNHPLMGDIYTALFESSAWALAGETSIYIPQSMGRRTRTNNLLLGFDWDFLRTASNTGALQVRYTNMRTREVNNASQQNNWRRDTWLGWSPHDMRFEIETYPKRSDTGTPIDLDSKELIAQWLPTGQSYGYWLQNVPIETPFALYNTTLYNLYYRYLRENQHNLKVDFDFQIGRYNRAKMGFQVTDVKLFRYYYTGTSTYRDPRSLFKYNPQVVGAYMQNRTDLGDFVIDYGIRYDQATPRENWGITDIDVHGEHVFPKTLKEWSPRFDVAFPVTDKAQLRFSYGVFTQMPSLSQLFGGSSGGSSIMNPGDLEFSRTDAFEAGISYLLTDNVVLDFVAYYKDISGNVSRKDFFRDYYAVVQERRIRKMTDGLSNRDNGNIKGIDLVMRKRFSHNFDLNLSYTLQFSRTTGSQANEGFYDNIDPSTGESFIEPSELNPIDGDRTHSLAARFNYMFPEDFQAGTTAGQVLKNVRASVIYRILSGAPTGGSSDYSVGGLVYGTNYFRGRWNTDLTLRFSKSFRLAGSTRLEVFSEIFNALNRKNNVRYPTYYYEYYDNITGGADLTWSDNLTEVQKVRFNADFDGNGVLTVEEAALGQIAYRMISSTMDKRDWGTGRQIRLGLGLNF
jgi:Carboxypeptidase regulatory-like domain/TonB dependent receptor-like, beta-barrel/TonB-dependent Receptor Plug Domain